MTRPCVPLCAPVRPCAPLCAPVRAPQEVLLPPLTGLEAIGSSVEGKLLSIHSRLSLNLSAQTLEQVLSRRRKMLMDMATGIEFELRETLGDGSLYKTALRILRRALAYGALAQTPEWFSKLCGPALYDPATHGAHTVARALPMRARHDIGTGMVHARTPCDERGAPLCRSHINVCMLAPTSLRCA